MPFVKGQSGNPAGRRREDSTDVKLLARVHTKAAIERLAYWMRSDEPRASVVAAQILLDRGYGKPAQALTGPDGEALLPTVVVHTLVRPGLPESSS